MAAGYYLDAVYVLMLDSARQEDSMSRLGENQTHYERDLKQQLGITDGAPSWFDEMEDDEDEDVTVPEQVREQRSNIRQLRRAVNLINNAPDGVTRG